MNPISWTYSRKEYEKAWRERNKEQLKAYMKKWREERKRNMHDKWIGLNFSELYEANRIRNEEAFESGSWGPTDWATAVAGEVGEACNLIKKQRRGENIDIALIGKELADAVIYIDLLAQRLGLVLGVAVQEKFNEVSERVGSEIKLPFKRHSSQGNEVRV